MMLPIYLHTCILISKWHTRCLEQIEKQSIVSPNFLRKDVWAIALITLIPISACYSFLDASPGGPNGGVPPSTNEKCVCHQDCIPKCRTTRRRYVA